MTEYARTCYKEVGVRTSTPCARLLANILKYCDVQNRRCIYERCVSVVNQNLREIAAATLLHIDTTDAGEVVIALVIGTNRGRDQAIVPPTHKRLAEI